MARWRDDDPLLAHSKALDPAMLNTLLLFALVSSGVSTPAGPPALILCTPESVALPGAAPQATRQSIAAALSKAGPGTVIELAAGVYEPFSIGFGKPVSWNAQTSGGLPGQPIVVRANGEVRIAGNKTSDAIAIQQAQRCGHITFEGLTIEPGYRAGVMFYRCNPGQMHEGFRFIDCKILGGYDHRTESGHATKWGVWGHSLKDFEFRGLRAPAVVRDIRNEHAFYLQNSRGDITIENVNAARLGRTFVQLTARASDGPAGVGTIRVERCVVEDACIASGDNYKGGSALTLAGNHTGAVIFKNNRVRSGFAKELAHLTRAGAPFGTGAFVAWDAGGERNGLLVLENNHFEFAPGCGDRPLAQISSCREVRLLGNNRFIGGKAPALVFDVAGQKPNLAVSIAPTTVVQGEIRIGAKTVTREQLSSYRGSSPPPAEGASDK